MSLLLALLVVAQDAPEVRTRGISIEAKPFYFEPPVAPAVGLYFDCLVGQLGSISSDVVATFEASINHCSDARAEAMAAADKLLASAGWSDTERRRRSTERTFSEIDASHRDQARQLIAMAAAGTPQRNEPDPATTGTEKK